MQLSLNWLKNFVNIPETLTPEELGLKLTMHTVEIDGIKKQAENLDGVVVGEILEIKKHPNADKLNIAQVDVGEIKPRQIIFGQMIKVENGFKLPVALAPTVLPTSQEIKKTKLRGEISEGMFCLDQELGLVKDGISAHFFNKSVKNGTSIIEALELNDVIFEVDNKSITHRPDLWGHYGMAREISTFLNVQMTTNDKIPNPKSQIPNKSKIQNSKLVVSLSNPFKINVNIEDYKLCPRYMAIALEGIKVQESPQWMQKRLMSVGMRPINNIVDITNYVMIELGQPSHIFDLGKIKNMEFPISNFKCPIKSKIQNPKLQTNIIIRNVKNGEVIKTLDGQDRKLDENMLVIANSENPIAIAGVMGGANSEVDDNTTSILIEVANFNSVSIRKTAQKLGLRSEASIRFEKSLDLNLCEIALGRIIELIKEFCPNAEIISELQDEKKYFLNQGPIELDLEWLNKRIGKKIEEKKIVEILENLGFKIEKDSDTILMVTIPTWRATKDISIPEDLVEEIIRIYSYDNLDPEMPKITMQAPEINNERLLERKIKNILSVGAKLTEVYNYSFVGEEQLKKMEIDFSSHIKLVNPIATRQTMLCQSLIPNLLENIKLNQAKYENINLFEIGNVFLNSFGNINKDNKTKDTLPKQEKYIAIIISSKENNLFNKIKGIVEYLINSLGLKIDFEPIKIYPEWADPIRKKLGFESYPFKDKEKRLYSSQSQWAGLSNGADKKIIAQINILNQCLEVELPNIGIVAQLNNQVAMNLGIKKQIAIAEINFKKLYDLILSTPEKKYKELEKYPAVVRDLAFVVDEEILYIDIKNEIENFDELIGYVELFDVYQGGKLGQNKKNLAFHIIYQADKTLTTEEVDEMQEKLIKHLEDKFKAQIRNF
ncbi:phenylalanine--tRNA ligase subunit beta [Candidatus Kuenenbacteria bacterium]|nr:phenylalanine--tRNA ligase subunit beta [Candidatus Kuenenbacteria bacterium]